MAVAVSSKHIHSSVIKLTEGGAPLSVVRGTGVVGGLMEWKQVPTLPSMSVADTLRSGVRQEIWQKSCITVTPPWLLSFV